MDRITKHDDVDKSVEATRLHAVERIHQEELDRYDAQMATYELDKANAIFKVEEFCGQFRAIHVKAWVERWARRNGQEL